MASEGRDHGVRKASLPLILSGKLQCLSSAFSSFINDIGCKKLQIGELERRVDGRQPQGIVATRVKYKEFIIHVI